MHGTTPVLSCNRKPRFNTPDQDTSGTAAKTPHTGHRVLRRTPVTEPSHQWRTHEPAAEVVKLHDVATGEISGRRVPTTWVARLGPRTSFFDQSRLNSAVFAPPPALPPSPSEAVASSMPSPCRGATSAGSTPHKRFHQIAPPILLAAPGISLGLGSESSTEWGFEPASPQYSGVPGSPSVTDDEQRCAFIKVLVDSHLVCGGRSLSSTTLLSNNCGFQTPSIRAASPQMGRMSVYLRPTSYWPYRVNDPYDSLGNSFTDVGDRRCTKTKLRVPNPITDPRAFDEFAISLSALREEAATATSRSRARAQANHSRCRSRLVGNWPNWALVAADLSRGYTTITEGIPHHPPAASLPASPQFMSVSATLTDECEPSAAFALPTFRPTPAVSDDDLFYPFDSASEWRQAADKMSVVYNRYCSRVEVVSRATSPNSSPYMSPLMSPTESFHSADFACLAPPPMPAIAYTQFDVVNCLTGSGNRLILTSQVESVEMSVDHVSDRASWVADFNESRFEQWVEHCVARASDDLIFSETDARCAMEKLWLSELIDWCADQTATTTVAPATTKANVACFFDHVNGGVNIVSVSVEAFSCTEAAARFEVSVHNNTTSPRLLRMLEDYLLFTGVVSRVSLCNCERISWVEAALVHDISWSSILSPTPLHIGVGHIHQYLPSNCGSLVLLRGNPNDGSARTPLSAPLVGLFSLDALSDPDLLNSLYASPSGAHDIYVYSTANMARVAAIAHQVLCTNVEARENEHADSCLDQFNRWGFAVDEPYPTLLQIMASELDNDCALPLHHPTSIHEAVSALSSASCISHRVSSPGGHVAQVSYSSGPNEGGPILRWIVFEIAAPATQAAAYACETPVNVPPSETDLITPEYQRLPWGVGGDESPVVATPPHTVRTAAVEVKALRPNAPKRKPQVQPQTVLYREAKAANRPTPKLSRGVELLSIFLGDSCDITPKPSPLPSPRGCGVTGLDITTTLQSVHMAVPSQTDVRVWDLNCQLAAAFAECRRVQDGARLTWPLYVPPSSSGRNVFAQGVVNSLQSVVQDLTLHAGSLLKLTSRPTPLSYVTQSSQPNRYLSKAKEAVDAFNLLGQEAFRFAIKTPVNLSDVFLMVERQHGVPVESLTAPLRPDRIRALRALASTLTALYTPVGEAHKVAVVERQAALASQLKATMHWLEYQCRGANIEAVERQFLLIWRVIKGTGGGDASDRQHRMRNLWLPDKGLGVIASQLWAEPAGLVAERPTCVWANLCSAQILRGHMVLSFLTERRPTTLLNLALEIGKHLLEGAKIMLLAGNSPLLSATHILWLTETAKIARSAMMLLILSSGEAQPSKDVTTVAVALESIWLRAVYDLSCDADLQLKSLSTVGSILKGRGPRYAKSQVGDACLGLVVEMLLRPSARLDELSFSIESIPNVLHLPLVANTVGTLLDFARVPFTPVSAPARRAPTRQAKSDLFPTDGPPPPPPRVFTLLGLVDAPPVEFKFPTDCDTRPDIPGIFTRFDTALESYASCAEALRCVSTQQAASWEDAALGIAPDEYSSFVVRLKNELRTFFAQYDNVLYGTPSSASLRALVSISWLVAEEDGLLRELTAALLDTLPRTPSPPLTSTY